MANSPGHLLELVTTGYDSNRPIWFDTPVEFNMNPDADDHVQKIRHGSRADNNGYDPNTKNIDGHFIGEYTGGYVDIFYYIIHYTPAKLQLGNLTSNTKIDLIVFNAYFVEQNLESITENNLEGVGITGEIPPTIYKPLAEITYEISVLLDGDPEINGSFLFDWTVPDDTILPVTGSRIVAMPYIWENGVDEKVGFKNSILTSYDGTEQRRVLRKTPRQQFNFKMAIENSEMTKASNLLFGWRKRNFAVPVWTELRRSNTPTLNTVDTIDVSTLYGDFRIGTLCIIWENHSKWDIFKIETFDAVSITAERNIGGNFNQGAFVAPVRVLRLLADPKRLTDGYNGEVSMNGESVENILLPTTESDFQFLGEDVLLKEPLKQGNFSNEGFNSRVDVVDFNGFGKIEEFAPWLITKTSKSFKFILDGLEEIWEYREWLHRRKGTIRPFYMPSWESDFTIKNSGTIITSLLVVDNGQSGQGKDRRNICFHKIDGTFEFRAIDSFTKDEINNEITIIFSGALNLEPSEINFVSYLGLKRLKSDSNSFKWHSNNVAELKLNVLEIG